MEVTLGYSYHIKDEFFDMIQDKYLVSNKDNVFLIQNAFPILKKYFAHVHTVEGKPVVIHSKLNRELTANLREVLAMYRRGIRLIFPDIEYIQRKMEDEFEYRIGTIKYVCWFK